MRKLIKKILCFFRTVIIFETKKNSNFRIPQNFKFTTVKSLKNIHSKEILSYFRTYNMKKKRFGKNCIFLILKNDNKIVSSGWLYKGEDNWTIEEINQKIDISKKLLIFDFITPVIHRNKGYYTMLLKTISNKFKNKSILIYALSSNNRSIKAIKRAGFKFKKKLDAKL